MPKHSSSVGYIMIITPFSEPHTKVMFITQLYGPFAIRLNKLLHLKMLIQSEGEMRI